MCDSTQATSSNLELLSEDSQSELHTEVSHSSTVKAVKTQDVPNTMPTATAEDPNIKLLGTVKGDFDRNNAENLNLTQSVKDLMEQVSREQEEIKTITRHDARQKKEIQTLTRERDDVVKERKHLHREWMHQQTVNSQFFEENHLLLARVESLRTLPAPFRPASLAKSTPTADPCQPTATTSSSSAAGKGRIKVAVIGDSNIRRCSNNLNNAKVDTIVRKNPGVSFGHMPQRIISMAGHDRDAAVVHLGTKRCAEHTFGRTGSVGGQ